MRIRLITFVGALVVAGALVVGAAALLFLGGWHTGFLPFEPSASWGWGGHILNVTVFIGKCSFLVFVMMWMRWSLLHGTYCCITSVAVPLLTKIHTGHQAAGQGS